MTIKNIFSSIAITINHLKAKYRDHVQANRVKLLLQELQEAEHTQIQLDWISEHRREIRRANNIIQREIHLGATYSHYETQVQNESPPEPSTLKELRQCDIELKLLNIEYFQHLERKAELMNRKPPGRFVCGTTPNGSGLLNGPTANFVVAVALVSVVAVNDLGTPFGILLERFDICTAQEVVDAAPAIAVILQVW
ncbi:hypothetical protein N7517_010185 [Penicillium concentricum]|uniref:Uncharacterized protein n=1 Tax=Penicillium concentricum TaxID=293559 RepID=A0A9W9R8I9_9EURO|nr:uncharacterized protein N7517_010185 [Penicillium concentricum]KAJ5355576.1 hypothetical protein N7517_010185 [Penicillium concentricum]